MYHDERSAAVIPAMANTGGWGQRFGANGSQLPGHHIGHTAPVTARGSQETDHHRSVTTVMLLVGSRGKTDSPQSDREEEGRSNHCYKRPYRGNTRVKTPVADLTNV